MRDTLLRLNRGYGRAKRRAELKLTRKRSKLLAEKGLGKENERRELMLTELGHMVAEIVASSPPQAMVAEREDHALRRQGGRALGSLPGAFRRLASIG